jgi:hypothetical protein
MALTVYVTEDFGTMKEEDRFQRRQVIFHGTNVHCLEKQDAYNRELERKAFHAVNLPRPTPNFFQRVLEGIQDRWYSFRLNLAQRIHPTDTPPNAMRDKAKLRYANTREQRKIIEELWAEIFPNPGDQDLAQQVLRIPLDTEFLVEDDE